MDARQTDALSTSARYVCVCDSRLNFDVHEFLEATTDSQWKSTGARRLVHLMDIRWMFDRFSPDRCTMSVPQMSLTFATGSRIDSRIVVGRLNAYFAVSLGNPPGCLWPSPLTPIIHPAAHPPRHTCSAPPPRAAFQNFTDLHGFLIFLQVPWAWATQILIEFRTDLRKCPADVPPTPPAQSHTTFVAHATARAHIHARQRSV